MATTAIIREINKLPLTEKLLLVEKTLKAIRHDREHSLEKAVELLQEDYRSDKELTLLT